MKLTKKQYQLIQRYNQKDTFLVISRWPTYAKASTGKPRESSFDGVATYTQDIVTKFVTTYNARYVVLAETVPGAPVIEETRKGILVIRAFDEKHFHLYPQVLTWLKEFAQVRKVYVHSEFCASGGPVLRFLVVPFLAIIRLTGKEITFYAHNVVRSLKGYEEHLGYAENSWQLKAIGIGYRWYFRLLSFLVDTFVVLENTVNDRLRKLVGNKPIVTEPHWILPARTRITQAEAKQKLGFAQNKRVVVSFGFVTHYKGADFVAKFADWMSKHKILPNTQIVLAGGMAYSLKNKSYYANYYQQIEKRAARNPQLTLTGFLSEAEVKLWMIAADVVILPYRNLMGGSGALQQALRFGKPVLMSVPMADGLGLQNGTITFNHTFGSLKRKLESYFTDRDYQAQVQSFSDHYASQLSATTLIPKHFNEVYATDRSSSRLLKWNQQVDYAVASSKA